MNSKINKNFVDLLFKMKQDINKEKEMFEKDGLGLVEKRVDDIKNKIINENLDLLNNTFLKQYDLIKQNNNIEHDIYNGFFEFLDDIIDYYLIDDSKKDRTHTFSKKCQNCGNKIFFEYSILNGLNISNFNKNPMECEYSNGKKEVIKFKLKIPSKKIVFSNLHMENFIKIDDRKKYSSEFSISTKRGIINSINFYAQNNLGACFVGNTSPTIYKNKNSQELIIDPNRKIIDFEGYHLSNNKSLETLPINIQNSINNAKNYDDLGYICTDLWWVIFSDFELLKEKLKENNINYDEFVSWQKPVIIELNNNIIDVEYNVETCVIKIKEGD